MIIDALSSYFLHGPPIKNKIVFNDKSIEEISTTIQNRPSQPEQQNRNTLDSLPTNLIGVCSSFLDQTSNAALSACNRSTYLGCNTPNKVEELSVSYSYDLEHQSLDLSTFLNTKRLKLNALDDDCELVTCIEKMEVIASQIAKMPQLQSLDLCDIDSEFIGIISKHQTTNQRTKSLSVELWENDEDAYDQLLSSITTFKHIESICVYITEDLGFEMEHQTKSEYDLIMTPLIGMCSNLKALNFEDDFTGIELPLIQAIGHQLQHLTLNDLDQRIESTSKLNDVNFENLRELRQGKQCEVNSVRTLLRTAVNLEKVRLRGDAELVEEILTKCDQLKYLEIDCVSSEREELGFVMTALRNALSRTKEVQRDTLKIKITADFLPFVMPELQEPLTKLLLEEIIDLLLENQVNHWMLILHLGRSEMPNSSPMEKDKPETLWDNVHVVTMEDGDDLVALITSPDCTICGFAENWLIDM